MAILENVFAQQIIQKIGWTLIHFLWQAAAIAILLAILLKLLRKSSAGARYIIACLALALIVVSAVITLQLIPTAVPDTPLAPPASLAPAFDNTQAISVIEVPLIETSSPIETTAAPAISLRENIASTLQPALPYIVLTWLIGVSALCIWHLGGWAQLQSLRRRMTKQVAPALRNKLKELARALGVRRVVQIAESALVQVPTVLGWLKPIILLPASALTGLDHDQLQAILAHELAHIKRHDYLINMLQTAVEILGFYHPAVWWISHKIRVERENCCDDLAVSISGDRLRYAKALTSMEQIRANYTLAVAATGGSLINRIRRLITKDPSPNSRAAWLPSIIAIVLIMALMIPTALALSAKTNQKTEMRLEDGNKQAAQQLILDKKLKESLKNPKVITQAAQQLFSWIRNANYNRILKYYDNGKWKKDGWKKLLPADYYYLTDTDFPSWVKWICQSFKDNPIVSVELGEVFVSPKEISGLDRKSWPTLPYKLTLKNGAILEGNLLFRYIPYGGGCWQGMLGLDWHLKPESELFRNNNSQKTNLQIETETELATKPVELELSTLPPNWILDYDDGSRPVGKIWRSEIANNLVGLQATPIPANEYDESWKQLRLNFKIVSQNGEPMGEITILGEREQENSRIVLSPDKYILSYTRARRDPISNCYIPLDSVKFPVDLSQPGIYELKFSPKLKPSKPPVSGKYPPTTCIVGITDDNGNSVVGADVAAYEMFDDMAGNCDLRLLTKTVTKANGIISFATTPSMRRSRSLGGIVVARKKGLALGWAEWPLYDVQQLTITLGRPTKLAGFVVDENGERISDAEIRAVLFEKKASEKDKTRWLPGIAPLSWLATRTDGKGRFEFDNIPADIRTDFIVRAAGFSTIYTRPEKRLSGYEGAEFTAGQTDIKIEMTAEGKIEGKLIDSKSGQAVPDVKLAVVPHFTPVFFERFLCVSKEDGTFSIGGLRSGEYLIRADKQKGSGRVNVTAKSGQTVSGIIVELQAPDPGAETNQKTDLQIESKNIAQKYEDEPAPGIRFEKTVHNFGEIAPSTRQSCEFKFTNTGKGILKIGEIKATCGCTVPKLKKKEYAPGESGTIHVTYRAQALPGTTNKRLYVQTSDKASPKVTLSVKARIVLKVDYSPKRLSLLFREENAGCPDIMLHSVDGQPFAIKQFKSTADAITIDYNPSVKAAVFAFKPRVDIEKLREDLRGSIEIHLTHPECKKIKIPFDILAEFEARPASINVFKARPPILSAVFKARLQEPVMREIWVLNNYDEDFEIESVTSQGQGKGFFVRVLDREKFGKRYKLTIEITPPDTEDKTKMVKNTLSVNIKDGEQLQIPCRVIYTKAAKKTVKDETPYIDAANKSEEAKTDLQIKTEAGAGREKPQLLEIRIYEISTLLEQPAFFNTPPGGMYETTMGGGGGVIGGGAGTIGSMDGGGKDSMGERLQGDGWAESLIWRITETIEPGSWQKAGGRGVIKLNDNKELIILQTSENHARIQNLLEQLSKDQIEITARFLLVPADPNSFFAEFLEKEKIAPLSNQTDPNYTSMLDAEQIDWLLRATKAHRGSKSLAAPKVAVLDGEEATFRTQRTIRYDYTEPNSITGQPEEKIGELPTGTVFWVKPELQPDGKNIMLRFNLEQTSFLGFVDGFPESEVSRIQTRVLVPDGGTILVGGQEVTVEQEGQQDGRKTRKKLLVLVKAEKHKPQQIEPQP